MSDIKASSSVYIIGAGVSGLIAAINLEKKGYRPIILEKSDQIGGRVRTIVKDGYQLDAGFQVLLDAYPLAKQYLSYKELDLQPLSPGAILFSSGEQQAFGDPLRDVSYFFPTVSSSAGTLADKWKIFQLKKSLEKSSLGEIFNRPELTTLDYLKERGFSDTIIRQFFRPFFSGIFLETELATSSRMFEFVYKMFGEGLAVIPQKGIGAIADQLRSQLNATTFQTNTEVAKVTDKEIVLSSGERLTADFIIIATEPGKLLPQFESTLQWKSCKNLYFTTPSRVIKKPIIGLNTREGALVNNIFYPSSIKTETRGEKELLSVTVIDASQLLESELIESVQKELTMDFGIEETTFLHLFDIPHALPNLEDLKYQNEPTEAKILDHVALAGDHLVNGSLNAAMASGEQAAEIADKVLSESYITLG